jgi:type II secretory pathway predicted ATPase ExeA
MFGQKTQPKWYFDSSIHVEALSRLLYLVDSREAFGFLQGPDGSGRSRLLLKLREELAKTGCPTLLMNLSGLDEDTAWFQLAQSLPASVNSRQGRRELLTLVRDEFAGRACCGLSIVLLLDDFHRACGNMDNFLRSLLAMGLSCQGRLSVVIATGRPLAQEFSDQSFVRISLTALDTAEAADFVRTMLKRIVIRPGSIDESAVRAVVEFSCGNPTQLSRLCELLQVINELSPETHLTEETVVAVMSELSPHSRSQTSVAERPLAVA